MNDTLNIRSRHRARILAMQALYQWNMAHGELNDIEAHFRVENEDLKVDWPFYIVTGKQIGRAHV